MPTPIQWLAATQTNTGTAANESQSDAQIIGLSNGNFLVAWTESGTTGVGTTAGNDIIGKIYDALGNVVVDSFRINSSFFGDDEDDFSIAATDDGGFVIVYIDDSIANANQTSVRWERHNDTGGLVTTASIADENVAADSLSNPQVSVNLLTNESYVSYTNDVGTNTDVDGVIVTATGTVGSVFNFAQNSVDFDGNADTAVLTGGNAVTVYREYDAPTFSLEAQIVNATGGLVANIPITNNSASDPPNRRIVQWKLGGSLGRGIQHQLSHL